MSFKKLSDRKMTYNQGDPNSYLYGQPESPIPESDHERQCLLTPQHDIAYRVHRDQYNDLRAHSSDARPDVQERK